MNRASLPRPRFGVVAILLFALMSSAAALAQTTASAPSGPSAAARERLADAASDPRLPAWQRDVMFGLARADDGATNDVARPAAPPAGAQGTDVFDGTWSELVIDSRRSHSAVYDPGRDRMVVFGGVDSANRYLNDTWVLELSGTPTWARLEPAGPMPTPRYDAGLIYDPKRDRIVIFGGRAGSSPYILSDVWALPLANNEPWERLSPAGTPPTARYGHTAIYSAPGERMVVFGGYDSTYVLRNDVWSLSLAGPPEWTLLAPAGTPPAARMDHAATYDPKRARMLICGGTTFSGALRDVWAMTLVGTMAWTELSPTGSPPPTRTGHSAVHDPVRDRMLVCEGTGLGTGYTHVWALSLAGTPAWSLIAADAPMPSERWDPATIYDPVRDRLVVFGGERETGGARNDVWAITLGGTPAWTELTPNGRPPDGRNFHAAILDPLRDRMLVFGGAGVGGARLDDLCALSTVGRAVWSVPVATGTPPSRRYGHSAIYDPVRDRMVVFGGYAGLIPAYVNDVWELSLAGTPAWTQLAPTGAPPIPRAYHSAIHDPVRDRMLVFAGTGFDGVSSGTYNDVWALSLAGTPAWSQLAPTGTPPWARQQTSAIYDPVRDRMVVFGGDAGTRLNDVQALTLAGVPAWSALAPTGTKPSARAGHIAIYDPVRDRMVVCGGIPAGTSAETWELSLAGTPAWTQLAPTSLLPDARASHTGVYDAERDRMIVFGGDRFRNDVWALTWTMPVSVEEPPVAALAFLRTPAPNPSCEGTTVTFAIARAGHVRLSVYDVRGRLVRTLLDGERSAGETRVRWDGTDGAGARLAAGVYFLRLVGPDVRVARRVVVLE